MRHSPTCSQHTVNPHSLAFRLALVTIFQFLEGLTDRQEAFAVRDRLAWKYALGLELTDDGFDHTVLSEFRSRLIAGHAEQRLLDLRIARGVGREGGSKPMEDNGRTLLISWRKSAPSAAPCELRVSMVYVLNVLSEVAPAWIRAHIPVEWVERYGQRLEEEREPLEEQERTQYANQVGADGWMLLDALQASCTPDPLENAPCRGHPTHHVGATV
jgi:transposase